MGIFHRDSSNDSDEVKSVIALNSDTSVLQICTETKEYSEVEKTCFLYGKHGQKYVQIYQTDTETMGRLFSTGLLRGVSEIKISDLGLKYLKNVKCEQDLTR